MVGRIREHSEDQRRVEPDYKAGNDLQRKDEPEIRGPARQKPATISPPTPIAIMNSGFLPNHFAMRDVIETATRNARPFETRNAPNRSCVSGSI